MSRCSLPPRTSRDHLRTLLALVLGACVAWGLGVLHQMLIHL